MINVTEARGVDDVEWVVKEAAGGRYSEQQCDEMGYRCSTSAQAVPLQGARTMVPGLPRSQLAVGAPGGRVLCDSISAASAAVWQVSTNYYSRLNRRARYEYLMRTPAGCVLSYFVCAIISALWSTSFPEVSTGVRHKVAHQVIGGYGSNYSCKYIPNETLSFISWKEWPRGKCTIYQYQNSSLWYLSFTLHMSDDVAYRTYIQH